MQRFFLGATRIEVKFMNPSIFLLGAVISFFTIGGRVAFSRLNLGILLSLLVLSTLFSFILNDQDPDLSWQQIAAYSGALFIAAMLHGWHRLKLSAVTLGASIALALLEVIQEKNEIFNYVICVAAISSSVASTLLPERPASTEDRGRIFLGYFSNWMFGYLAVKAGYMLHNQVKFSEFPHIDQTLFGAVVVVAGLAVFNVINDLPIPARRSFARALKNSRSRLTQSYINSGSFSIAIFLVSLASFYLLLNLAPQWDPKFITLGLVLLAAL